MGSRISNLTFSELEMHYPDTLRAALESAHTYEVPEVIAIPIVDGSPNYLSWIDQELQPAEIK